LDDYTAYYEVFRQWHRWFQNGLKAWLQPAGKLSWFAGKSTIDVHRFPLCFPHGFPWCFPIYISSEKYQEIIKTSSRDVTEMMVYEENPPDMAELVQLGE
jgi:hypothetical protein